MTARVKNKKVKRPGYKLLITQNTLLPEEDWETIIVYEEEFKQDQLNKAIDIFQRELLNIQSWILIAEPEQPSCLIIKIHSSALSAAGQQTAQKMIPHVMAAAKDSGQIRCGE